VCLLGKSEGGSRAEEGSGCTEAGIRPPEGERRGDCVGAKALWAQWYRLVSKYGILFRRWEGEGKDADGLQRNVPAEARDEIIRSLHDSPVGGHLGYEKTQGKVRDRYCWPGYTKDGSVAPHVRRLFAKEIPAPSTKSTTGSLPDRRTDEKNFRGHSRSTSSNHDRQ
jgi:hypothetical protein